MLKDLKAKIDEASVISFDIFDTLIVRIVGCPETVFDIIGRDFSIDNFRHIRMSKQAEIGLKLQEEKNYPHANIREIYDYIKESTNINNTDKLMEYEEKLEEELLYKNNRIYDIFKYAKSKGKRVVATSDMYLDENFIKKVLDKCGYEDIDKIYLSSSERKAKFTGELYDVLIESEKVDPSKILHIGDNLKDDVEIATSKGLSVYHYKETILKDKTTDIALSFHYGISRYISLQTDNFWEKFGTIGGMLYLGLYKELIKNTKDRIYFLARDGYNLYNIFKKFSKDRKVSYVYTSRRAMLLGGITKIDEEALSILPPFTFGQTIKEILDYISMDNVFTVDDLKKVGFSDFSDTIEDDTDVKKFKNLYTLKEDAVLKVCKEERDNALKYFSSLGMLDGDNYIFDCGWNGSSQYFLSRLFKSFSKNIKNHFYYAGIFDNKKSRKQLINEDFDTYLFGFCKNQDLVLKLQSSIAILELFFGASHNSVLRYDKDGYVLDDFDEDVSIKDDILKGLISYLEMAFPIFDKYNLEFSSTTSIESIVKLIENPDPEVALKIGNLVNVDGFAYKEKEKHYIAYVTMDQIRKNPNIEIYWPQAIMVRSDIDEDVKAYVKKRFNLGDKSLINYEYLHRFRNLHGNNGYRTTLYLLKEKIKSKLMHKDSYLEWIKNNSSEANVDFSYKPFISFIVPVYNCVKEQLIECIESVLNQSYTNFELILVDDCSTLDETFEVLSSYKDYDNIKIKYHKKNEHISKTTNDGIDMAKGEFIALLDNDDVLEFNALEEMVRKLNEKEYDFVYSDEDKLTEDGSFRHNPFFKPDWSIDTFLSLMYTCHFSIFRKTIVDEIKGFTVGLDGAQDYDFVLRFIEKTDRIGHVSKVLYHWRERVGSIASDPEAKEYALKAIVKLKENYLKRHNLKGDVVYNRSVFQYRMVYDAVENSVSVLIQVSDVSNTKIIISDLERSKLKCLDSIYLLVNDKKYVKEFSHIFKKYKIFTIDDVDKVKNVCSKVILFLSDKITINVEDIETMAGHSILEHVGMLGPKILYNNTTFIYSDGLSYYYPFNVLGEEDDNITHYYCRNVLDYNTIAVSSLCLMIKKDLFNDLKFINSMEELIKFGKYLYDKKYYSVVRNDVTCYIKREDIPRDSACIRKLRDPFINPNIDLYHFSILNDKRKNTKIRKENISLEESLNISYRMNYEIENDYIGFDGFAFSSDINHNNSNKVDIVLRNDDNTYILSSKKVFNDYVSLFYCDNYNFSNFYVKINKEKIEKGNYEVWLVVNNKLDKKIIQKRIIEEIVL